MSLVESSFGEPAPHDAALETYDTLRQALFGSVVQFYNLPVEGRAKQMFAVASAMCAAHVKFLESLALDRDEVGQNIRLLAGLRRTESSIRHHFFASLIGEESTVPAITDPETDYANQLGTLYRQSLEEGLADDEEEAMKLLAGGIHNAMADEYEKDINTTAEIRLSTPLGRLCLLESSLREHGPRIAAETAKIALGTGIGVIVGSRLRR